MSAKISSISISGIRTLDRFKLDLNGLTVLIGENGSGKSSIVEACELLKRLTNPQFFNEFNQIHGGEAMLLRYGAGGIRIGAEIAGTTWRAGYEVAFGKSGISSESLWITPGKDLNVRVNVIKRTGSLVELKRIDGGVDDPDSRSGPRRPMPAQHVVIGLIGISHPDPLVAEISEAIRNIDVQLPFHTIAYWSSRSQGGQQTSQMRDSVTIAPATQLDRFGVNLANAFHTLKNEATAGEWGYTMELVRLGLGPWVESVNTRADAGGGKIALSIKVAGTDRQIQAASLSDGQLSYLAFVALARLPTERSLLVFDEIELHLHPRLLIRVLTLMQTIAETTPVLITTHSRRLLDELDEPAKSVAVLELEPQSLSTKLRRLDEVALKSWLEDYDGLGHLLDAGYQESFLAEPSSGEAG